MQYRYGTGVGALGALVIPLVAAFCCGATSVASNSRCAATPAQQRHTKSESFPVDISTGEDRSRGFMWGSQCLYADFGASKVHAVHLAGGG